jgi:hypothetical protein
MEWPQETLMHFAKQKRKHIPLHSMHIGSLHVHQPDARRLYSTLSKKLSIFKMLLMQPKN